MEPVIYTKKFNSYLRQLNLSGQKKIVQAVRAAMAEAGTNAIIESLPRTKHGESRLKNIEKFDLPDAYRLVVQRVGNKKQVRAFLFVGTHDDAEKWLDSHRNYTWVKSPTDGTLNFIPITYNEERYVPADRLDLESPESDLEVPLLRHLTDEEWSRILCSEQQKILAMRITGEQYEQDAEGILEKLDQLGNYEAASLLLDLFVLAHGKDWDAFHRRLEIFDQPEIISDTTKLQSEMNSLANVEQFVTFDDEAMLDGFFEKMTFSDWMLFLHPEQKKIAHHDYKGPARLRGVSGSGKTSVLVHRARYLAKKYSAPVLLVTLTESMRKLLEKLVEELCGAERSLIFTKTMNSLARDVFNECYECFPYPQVNSDVQHDLLTKCIAVLREDPSFVKTPMRGMVDNDLRNFLKEEFEYVRGRLRPCEFNKYLDTNLFHRRGRAIPLNKSAREVMVRAVAAYENGVEEHNLSDHELIVARAIDSLAAKPNNGQFRSILIDEVQDLTELDVVLLSKLATPDGEVLSHVENGLFLAGDGAQSIYKRGFALKRAGVDVIGRSVSLKKNYRNTHEILKAAFNLVSEYEFSDTDEDEVRQPSLPDFAKRHGERPLLLQCTTSHDEVEAVVQYVSTLLSMSQTAGQICIIAPQQRLRTAVREALDAKGVACADLKHDVNFDSDNVKISTIESAKGHEFGAVLIMGLVEGYLPHQNVKPHELAREASRLYVAMTRARESLCITYSPSSSHPASRFLMSIQKDCDEAKYRNGKIIPLVDG
ncbi:3'-5' exonuclease [Acetobacter persici]|uniref:3'-5' exonuclease n=1 Tax=Acetobacter persici TaxID=1076596 RepID=UPI001BA9CD58|nr:3'-5' exonuclease [Acetobacter persici]MBS0963817.1 UvrD-helicase domain-containing protein [Acetobacter persici]